MIEIIGLIVCIIIFICILNGFGKPTPYREPCKKKPHLSCTVTKVINRNGSLEIKGGIGGCCMYKSQFKAMNKAFCRMVPGKDYNGMSITEGLHRQAMRMKEHYENLDDSGPTEYKEETK